MYVCMVCVGLMDGLVKGCHRDNCPFAHVKLDDLPGGEEALNTLFAEVGR